MVPALTVRTPEPTAAERDLLDMAASCGEVAMVCEWAREALTRVYLDDEKGKRLVALRHLRAALDRLPGLIAEIEAA